MLMGKVQVSHRTVNNSYLPVNVNGLFEKVKQVPKQVKSGVTTYLETKQSSSSLKFFIIYPVAERRFGMPTGRDFIMLAARVDL